MQTYKSITRWGIIIASLVIVSLILWNTYIFFQRFKEQERTKVEILASAYKKLSTSKINEQLELERKILQSNTNIPLILTDGDGIITNHRNLDERKLERKDYLENQLALMKSQNQPFIILSGQNKQYIYYKDSQLLTKLKYYPLALLLVLVLFGFIIYLYSKTNKIASQNQLWTGMAKETAHQIGTPLTSLLGWVAILREDKEKKEIADEIEKDVQRLESIANRFSKIGSEPALVRQNIVEIAKNTFDYLQSRSSNQIEFEFSAVSDEIFSEINPELLGWVIENLVKNSIDAMQGKGKIRLDIQQNHVSASINISDSGKGISKNLYKRIFDPGFTTKQRGWGIGLSLSKRIVEKFHHGKIYVLKSALEKGTTFCVKLPKVK